MRQRYRDRRDAGRALAEALASYAGRDDVLVLALPRGGVPVGFEVAQRLGAPLDVFLVRKLGVPGHEELAMGAIASGGVRVLNREVLSMIDIGADTIAAVANAEQRELERRELEYRGGRPAPDVRGKTVILVDDGLATGSTMRAAARALRALEPTELVVAAPVAAEETCAELAREADRVVCPFTPEPFQAVGLWYQAFEQTTDAEVRELLEQAGAAADDAAAAGAGSAGAVRIESGDTMLDGDLVLPSRPAGVVLFAHGSGSSRHSPRNRHVAGVLQRAGLATLLMDLLTEQEEAEDARTGHLRFDIGLLAGRLVTAIDWLGEQRDTRALRAGCFGAST
ncbi:MAG: phosphoribosyltransferase family protein, partial [Longimicrobiales bacterium]